MKLKNALNEVVFVILAGVAFALVLAGGGTAINFLFGDPSSSVHIARSALIGFLGGTSVAIGLSIYLRLHRFSMLPIILGIIGLVIGEQLSKLVF